MNDEQTGQPLALSSSLKDLLSGLHTEKVSIDSLLEHFGTRSYGVIIVLFTIPNILPGLASFAGLALLLFSVQMTMAIKKPWLPRVISQYQIPKASLQQGIQTLLPYIIKIEHYFHPRLNLLNSNLAMRFFGIVISLMAFLIVIPVPFSNFIPAIILLLLGLALLQKDGLIALLASVAAGAYAYGYAIVLTKVVAKLLA